MVGIALQRPIACSRRSEDKTIEIVVDDWRPLKACCVFAQLMWCSNMPLVIIC